MTRIVCHFSLVQVKIYDCHVLTNQLRFKTCSDAISAFAKSIKFSFISLFPTKSCYSITVWLRRLIEERWSPFCCACTYLLLIRWLRTFQPEWTAIVSKTRAQNQTTSKVLILLRVIPKSQKQQVCLLWDVADHQPFSCDIYSIFFR